MMDIDEDFRALTLELRGTAQKLIRDWEAASPFAVENLVQDTDYVRGDHSVTLRIAAFHPDDTACDLQVTFPVIEGWRPAKTPSDRMIATVDGREEPHLADISEDFAGTLRASRAMADGCVAAAGRLLGVPYRAICEIAVIGEDEDGREYEIRTHPRTLDGFEDATVGDLIGTDGIHHAFIADQGWRPGDRPLAELEWDRAEDGFGNQLWGIDYPDGIENWNNGRHDMEHRPDYTKINHGIVDRMKACVAAVSKDMKREAQFSMYPELDRESGNCSIHVEVVAFPQEMDEQSRTIMFEIPLIENGKLQPEPLFGMKGTEDGKGIRVGGDFEYGLKEMRGHPFYRTYPLPFAGILRKHVTQMVADCVNVIERAMTPPAPEYKGLVSDAMTADQAEGLRSYLATFGVKEGDSFSDALSKVQDLKGSRDELKDFNIPEHGVVIPLPTEANGYKGVVAVLDGKEAVVSDGKGFALRGLAEHVMDVYASAYASKVAEKGFDVADARKGPERVDAGSVAKLTGKARSDLKDLASTMASNLGELGVGRKEVRARLGIATARGMDTVKEAAATAMAPKRARAEPTVGMKL